MITKLLRFNFVSEQPEMMVKFYRDTLKIPVLAEDENYDGVCFGFVNEPHFTIWRANEKNPKSTGNSQLVFICDDVEESYIELTKRGLVCNKPYEAYWGRIVLEFSDPDGNLIRLRS